jgi:peptide deformylase
MEIVKYPNDILNKACSVVLEFTPALHQILDDMYQTMVRHRGVGLAANQVGLDMSMFIMKTKAGELIEVINPFIVGFSEEKANLTEGCLSAPNEFDVVEERHKEVEIEFQDRNGVAQRRKFSGIDSVCVQHEYDHINGIFFFSKLKLNRQRRRQLERKWGKI